MGRKNRHKKQNRQERPEAKTRTPWHADLHPETKKGVAAIFCFVIAVVLALSYIGKGGTVGAVTFQTLSWLLGKGYFFAPITFILMGASLLIGEKRKIVGVAILGGMLFLCMSLALLEITLGAQNGGVIGSLIGGTLFKLFDFWASLVISIGLFIVSFLIMLNIPLFKKHEEVDIEEPEENSMAHE